tara:strand:+ start:206 stop:577 length:372 start_codon:yes stop_codon:yes gene_type:complete
MYKLIEVGISLLLMYGGIEIGKLFSDSLYEVHLSNGEIVNIKVNKNNVYSCPVNCGAFHFHSTKTNIEIDNNYSMNFDLNNDKITLNEFLVSSIYNIKLHKDKKSNKKIEKTKVSLKNFILKY